MNPNEKWGAICGDVLGSVYESPAAIFKTDNPDSINIFRDDLFFTDDTVLTVATMDCLNNKSTDFLSYYKKWFNKYPRAGFAKKFAEMMKLEEPTTERGSGNGCLMRAHPLSFLENSPVDDVVSAAVDCTHDASAKRAVRFFLSLINYVRLNYTDSMILKRAAAEGFDLGFTLNSVRLFVSFHVDATATLLLAAKSYLASDSYKGAIQNAISLGGDTDTLACVTGAIAAAQYGVPDDIVSYVKQRLTLEMLDVIEEFK